MSKKQHLLIKDTVKEAIQFAKDNDSDMNSRSSGDPEDWVAYQCYIAGYVYAKLGRYVPNISNYL